MSSNRAKRVETMRHVQTFHHQRMRIAPGEMNMTRRLLSAAAAMLSTFSALGATPTVPGRDVPVGSITLHIHCEGKGSPTAVIDTGLGDFSFDWMLVQQDVARSTRICTYDRAGYGTSQPSDRPRTFAQLSLELHALLHAAGERPPFVLVGHSFGGGPVRIYVEMYPDETAGLVLAEGVAEHQPLVFGDQPVLLKDFATGAAIPEPELPNGKATKPEALTATSDIEGAYKVLPVAIQDLHRLYSSAPTLEAAETDQKKWSSEYYARWHAHPQTNVLKGKPLIVVTRARSGDAPSQSYSVENVDGARLRAQTEMLNLSTNSVQYVVNAGHNLHLEAPHTVATLIKSCVRAARTHARVPIE
jgi:pimeloyl-ACP methyl ester carboxylesterase